MVTLHLPPDWYPANVFQSTRANYYLNCVSSYQQRQCPPGAHLLPFIGNGVALERFHSNIPKRDFVFSLGRICPEKGLHFALDAAKLAGVDMYLAGEVFPYRSHVEYFEQEIRPRLDVRRQFIGPVGFARKRKLLAQARCLLVPSTVSETSSLVAMEALASGTPVIAYPSGALPEIVEHGRTGFLTPDVESMAEAIPKAMSLQPQACRDSARSRFSAKDMVSRYFDAYERILANTPVREAYPVRPGVSWLASW